MKGNTCLLSLSAYCMPSPLPRASRTWTQLSLSMKNRKPREAELLARVRESRRWPPDTQAFPEGASLGLCCRETSLASAHTAGPTPSKVRQDTNKQWLASPCTPELSFSQELLLTRGQISLRGRLELSLHYSLSLVGRFLTLHSRVCVCVRSIKT